MTVTLEAAADPQQAIAELRRQLDERIAERDEAVAQQTATAEVLQIISASPGDLVTVFDAMLDKALHLCEAAFGILLTFDGTVLRTVAFRNVPEALAEYMNQPLQPDPNTTLGRVVRERQTILTEDNAEAEPYRKRAPLAVAAVELGRSRTVLHVPLIRDEIVLGVVIIFRQVVRSFSDRQISLMQSFAAQAVIAIENARLITETREALAQQTATSEVLQVINSSPGKLTPVFDAMLEKATRLCEADFGILWNFEGDLAAAGALHQVPAAYADMIRAPFRPSPESGPARMMRGDGTFIVPDLLDFPPYHAGDPLVRAIVDLAGARTVVIAPLRKDGVTIGAITIYRQEVRPFTERQIDLLENFAVQAVIAMENARLITETREALEQQTATAEVLGVINSSPGNLTPVFDAILEKARKLCGFAHGTLNTYDGEYFRTVAFHAIPEAFADVLRQPRRTGPNFERLLRGEGFVQVADLADRKFSSDDPVHRAAVEIGGVRTLLMVPLRKDGVLLGYFTANRQEVRPFTDKQIALLQNFTAQAVIAMENARLITETREALEQQTATAEVLGVINSSPGDLTPVFDAILEKAHAICGAPQGAMYICEGEYSRAVAVRGLEPIAERLRAGRRIAGGIVGGRLLAGERFVHITDIAELDHFGVAGGSRTVLGVPLRKGDTLLGFISAARPEVRPFSDREIAVLENFAAQAVIAMENARLLGELRDRTDEVAGWNHELKARVAAQLAEIERTGKLRRFLAPQLADLIVAQGDESILESHRREIVVVFCDLRGFTAFAERAEPEEVMALLRDYHAAMGPIVALFEGTLDHYAGDGIMVFFNDPLPTPDPARRAIEMAAAMREAAQVVLKTWRRHGHDIGFGVGISQGYATLGQIGFAERMDYTAIGTVTNLAARLCGEAKDGQILVGRRVAIAVEDSATLEEIGDLSLKGLSQAVAVYNVVAVNAMVSGPSA